MSTVLDNLVGQVCATCGDTVALSWRNAAASAHVEVIAECHGMYGMFLLPREDVEWGSQGFTEWLAETASMPPLIREYQVNPDAPRITAKVRKPVSREVAQAARLGSDMEIDGDVGIVCGISLADPCAVYLGPEFP